jgi:hypothetical protein
MIIRTIARRATSQSRNEIASQTSKKHKSFTMVQTLKVSSFIAIIACAQLSRAFVVQRSTFLVPATPFSQVGIREHREVMFMAANNDDKKGTNEIDYGKILGMFVNPLNPYSWFFYFFVGINVYSAVSNN